MTSGTKDAGFFGIAIVGILLIIGLRSTLAIINNNGRAFALPDLSSK